MGVSSGKAHSMSNVSASRANSITDSLYSVSPVYTNALPPASNL